LVYNSDSQKYEKVKELTRAPLVLYQIFHENYQFFKIFEIIGIGSSLILILFQRIETDNSLILKYLKNLNGWFFKIQRTAQHWIAPL
jgi:hypothetical protein